MINEINVDLIPFICESFARNSIIHNNIRSLYNKYKNGLSRIDVGRYEQHPISKAIADEVKETYKMSLRIVSSLNILDIDDDFLNIVQSGWPFSYLFVNNYSVIDLTKFSHNYFKRNPSHTQEMLRDSITILIFLALSFDKEIIEDSLFERYMSLLETRSFA
jgi:hypothetical protein